MVRKNYLSLPLAAILTTLSLLAPKEALAISIKATATGSPNPTPIVGGNLQNGDFLILQNQFVPSLPTGDGVDETTNWLFDFSSDSNLALFPVSSMLDSAILTLTISPPGYDAFHTDVTGVLGGKFVFIPNIPDIPTLGSTGTVSIDLLDFGFTSEDIMNSFDSVTNTIPWFYEDDAVISSAELELTVEAKSVPEPTSIVAFLVAGAIAAGTLRGKKPEN